jgi:outer membrane receptor protein involved in Fe transport
LPSAKDVSVTLSATDCPRERPKIAIKYSIPDLGSDERNSYDLDVQHAFAWGSRQSIVWGGGVRSEEDNFPTVLSSMQLLLFSPQRRTLDYSNAFLQDSIYLSRTLKLIVGTKYEHDAYTRGEPLPNARLSWKVSDSNLLWAAVSRAVALPAMFANEMSGNTYGLEAWGNYQMSEWWRMSAGGNWLHENLHYAPGSSAIGGLALAGDDPSYQIALRSTMTVAHSGLLYLGLRHIGALRESGLTQLHRTQCPCRLDSFPRNHSRAHGIQSDSSAPS